MNRIRQDLLASRPARWLLRRAGFPLLLQGLALAAMLYLLVNGWGAGSGMSGAELKLLRKTNLTTLAVWGLWWPVMIGLTLALGRVWCTVCPLELAHRAAEALARRIGWPRARLGAWLSSGWATVLGYLVLVVLVSAYSLHRRPDGTAIMIAVLLGVAVLAGLIFREPRALCQAFCPAAALLSAYGRQTGLQLDTRDPAVCDSCQSKDCAAAANRFRFDARSCPSLIRPYRRDPADGCVLCLQCAKICPHDNLGYGRVPPEAGSRRVALLRPFETAFVLLVSGWISYEVCSEVSWLKAVFLAPAQGVAELVPALGSAWSATLWRLGLVPLILWGLAALLGLALGGRERIGRMLGAAATAAVPVIAAAQLAKGAAKLAAWAGFLPGALSDPRGLQTFDRLLGHAEQWPARLYPLWLAGGFGVVLVLALALWSWRRIGALPETSRPAARAGLIVFTLLYLPVLVCWLF